MLLRTPRGSPAKRPASSSRAGRTIALNQVEPLEPRRLLASPLAVSINFQPPAAATPAGYLADTGATFANRGNGFSYGWTSNLSSATRDRDSSRSADQRYDTIIHTQQYGVGAWEIAVPNGASG